MDSARFDGLSRMFASRRATLAGLGGVITGLLSRAADLEGAEARPTVCRPSGSHCFPSRGLDCCQGSTCQNGRCRVQKGKRRPKKCKPTKNRCCRNGDCPKGLTCRKRTCQCGAGQKLCAGRCIPTNQCCGGCADGQVCHNGTCGAARCGHGTPCRVFISESSFGADMGGLDGADAHCQVEADSSDLTSGGTYRAWLSTGAQSPTTRFNHVASSGPFQLVSGDLVANSWGDLISGADLINGITVTQDDAPSTAEGAWTNTTVNGTPAGALDCTGWTNAASGDGRIGLPNMVNANWTDDSEVPCAFVVPLYCFEQR